jgi:DNA-binding response OmpR family regulator
VLLLHTDPVVLHWLIALLERRNYRVSGVHTVDQANDLLDRWPVDLVIAPARVGTSNGLEFILACRGRHPELAGIILTGHEGHVVDMDAWRHGVGSISASLDPEAVLMVVAEHLAAIRRRQRWPRKKPAGEIAISIAGAPGRVVDVSYGGLRLRIETTDGDLPTRLHIDLPESQMKVRAELVWSAIGKDGSSYECGLAVTDDPGTTPFWRRFVDGVA